jgi:adenine phosphoribosyltransferase
VNPSLPPGGIAGPAPATDGALCAMTSPTWSTSATTGLGDTLHVPPPLFSTTTSEKRLPAAPSHGLADARMSAAVHAPSGDSDDDVLGDEGEGGMGAVDALGLTEAAQPATSVVASTAPTASARRLPDRSGRRLIDRLVMMEPPGRSVWPWGGLPRRAWLGRSGPTDCCACGWPLTAVRPIPTRPSRSSPDPYGPAVDCTLPATRTTTATTRAGRVQPARRTPAPMSAEALRAKIREIPDFPKPGILFYDITTLLKDPAAYREAIDLMLEPYRGERIDLVVGMESRGFIFSAPMAYQLNAGLVPVRKLGKLPAETITVEYALEYGSNTLEIHRDAIEPGQRVLIIDDLLATGGTVKGTIELVERLKGDVVGLGFLVELDFLKGRDRLDGRRVTSVIRY